MAPTFNDAVWLMVAARLFAGLVALGIGLWIKELAYENTSIKGR